jgi:hypothetical protein
MAVTGDGGGVCYIAPFSQTGPAIAKWREDECLAGLAQASGERSPSTRCRPKRVVMKRSLERGSPTITSPREPFHDVVAAPDRPVSIVIVCRGLRAPYCTNTMLSVPSLRVRSLPVSARLSW